MRFIVYLCIWVLGCYVFDVILNFEGIWFMPAGFIVHEAALYVSNRMAEGDK